MYCFGKIWGTIFDNIELLWHRGPSSGWDMRMTWEASKKLSCRVAWGRLDSTKATGTDRSMMIHVNLVVCDLASGCKWHNVMMSTEECTPRGAGGWRKTAWPARRGRKGLSAFFACFFLGKPFFDVCVSSNITMYILTTWPFHLVFTCAFTQARHLLYCNYLWGVKRWGASCDRGSLPFDCLTMSFQNIWWWWIYVNMMTMLTVTWCSILVLNSPWDIWIL